MRSWFALSSIAFVLFSIMGTIYARNIKNGLPTHFVLLTAGVAFVVAYGAQTIASPPQFAIMSRATWIALVAAAVCSVAANQALYMATSSAPNPAVALAIGGSQAVGVAILGYLLFRDALTLAQVIGIACVVGGTALVVLGKG